MDTMNQMGASYVRSAHPHVSPVSILLLSVSNVLLGCKLTQTLAHALAQMDISYWITSASPAILCVKLAM